MKSVYKLPFEATPQIKRYLDDILFIHGEWHQKKAFCLIKPYLPSELRTPKRVWNNVLFWSYLERKLKAVQTFSVITNTAVSVKKLKEALGEHRGIVAIARLHNDTQNPFKTFGTIKTDKIESVLKQLADMGYPGKRSPETENYLILKVLQIEPIKKLHNEIITLEQEEEKRTKNLVARPTKEGPRLIEKDGEGDFFHGKRRTIIKFRSKDDLAYQIFEAIYTLSNEVGGRVGFDEIIRYMKSQHNKTLRKKNITNAIDDTIDYKKLKPNKLPGGRKILERDGFGKSIIFNNPEL
ncbi:MAG: hypothetical protein HYS26_00640 [Candidatus Kaiserbacteria bacterium]|nr:MAG: hypothetical protein HYS26_00640 [Candidatus Kaiserbacteria bacterium]